MRSRSYTILVVIALVIAACSPANVSGDGATSTSASAGETTATAAVADATTTSGSADETTTTTQPEAGGTDLAHLMSSLDANAEIKSARVEGSIEMTGMDEAAAGVSEVVIQFSSAFDNETGDTSFLMDMSSMAGALAVPEDDPMAGLAAGFLGEVEFRQVDDRVFMKFPFFTAMLGAETDWVSMPVDGSEEFTSGFDTVPADPGEIIDAYENAEATVENLGSESVNGVDTTHYRITYDLEELEMTAEERADLQESGIFAGGVVPMDLWVSEDGYLVRMMLEVDGATVDAPPEEQFEKMTMTYDVFDINQPVVIEEPPESDVTDVDDLEGFGFGFGTDTDT